MAGTWQSRPETWTRRSVSFPLVQKPPVTQWLLAPHLSFLRELQEPPLGVEGP